MPNWFKFIRNFPMGVFIGAIIGGAYVLLIQAQLPDNVAKYGTYGITVLVSLLASAIALTTAIWNTETTRNRKLKAAKASLPLALSRLVTIARNGMRTSLEADDFFNNSLNTPIVEDRLTIPDDVFSTLKECIELGDEHSAQWLTNIISHYQIYKSGLIGLVDDPLRHPTDHYRCQHAAEWVFWHAMITSSVCLCTRLKQNPSQFE